MLHAVLNQPVVIRFNPFESYLPERMVVFGAGGRGRRCRTRLVSLGVAVPYLADNDSAKHGCMLDGALVIGPEELAVRAPGTPVLVSSWGEQDIVAQLHGLGVREVYVDGVAERVDPALIQAHAQELDAVIANFSDEYSRQLFLDVLRMRLYGTPMRRLSPFPLYRHPLVKARKGDCIIDGGAAEGDTLAGFMDDCAGDCELHLFEPTPVSYKQLQTYVEVNAVSRARAVNMALWSSDTTLRFEENFACAHSNFVCENGGYEVAATRLDSYVAAAGLERVDLIKLDIEGAELEALKGAEQTVRRHKPRLQICLYHKIEDLWEIPLWVKSVAPEYRLFLGHHSDCTLDTVLYGIAPEAS